MKPTKTHPWQGLHFQRKTKSAIYGKGERISETYNRVKEVPASELIYEDYIQYTWTGKSWIVWLRDKVICIGNEVSCPMYIENFVNEQNFFLNAPTKDDYYLLIPSGQPKPTYKEYVFSKSIDVRLAKEAESSHYNIINKYSDEIESLGY